MAHCLQTYDAFVCVNATGTTCQKVSARLVLSVGDDVPPSECRGLIAMTAAEYEIAMSNPFRLTVEEGLLVSGAIAAVWAVAWCWRALARTLQSDGEALQES